MTTYTDWQTRDGLIDHEVQQFVTPNVVVSYFYVPRLNDYTLRCEIKQKKICTTRFCEHLGVWLTFSKLEILT